MAEQKLKRDTTPMFDYYKAWDKFALEQEDKVDKADSDQSDQDEPNEDGFIPARNPKPEKEQGPMSQAQMMQRTSGARPNTKIVIKGGTVKKSSRADELKQQGNAFFMSGLFDKAIDCYTDAIPHIDESNHQLRCLVYSNRAQCNLKMKKYEKAYLDADKALEYDGNHLKSVQRRGTAGYYTKRYRQARRDFVRALGLEYSAQIDDYLQKVLEQINKQKAAAQDKLKRRAMFDCGINFHNLDDCNGDADDAKRQGVHQFKKASNRIEVVEMNLDEE